MRLIRSVVISVGLGVLGLLGLAEWALRRRYGVPTAPSAADADEVTEGAAKPVSSAVSKLRLLVGAAGVAVAVYGVVVVLNNVAWTSYPGIALWLAGAVILHDAVLVPAVSVLRLGAQRAGGRLPVAALALLKGGFVVGGVLSLIALPAIWAKHLGTLNPTVLPGAYGQALVVTWLAVVVVTLVGVAVVVVLAVDRQRSGSSCRADASRQRRSLPSSGDGSTQRDLAVRSAAETPPVRSSSS